MITLLTLIAMLSGTPDVSIYPMTMVAVEIDYELDAVTCVDFNGNEWAFFGTEDYNRGDYVSTIMSDNGTPDWIYDDEIISTRCGGWCDGSFGYDAESGYEIVNFSR